MSIENDLNRIASALEALVVHLTSAGPDEYAPSEGSEAPPAGAATGAAGPKRTRRAKAQIAADEAAAKAAAAQAQIAADAAKAAAAAQTPTETGPLTDIHGLVAGAAAPVPDNLTLPALRVRFAALATKGKREQLIKLLEDRGFKVLPDVPVERYPEIWRALDALEAS